MIHAVQAIESQPAFPTSGQGAAEEFIAPFAKARDEGRVLNEDELDDAIMQLISRHHAGDISKKDAVDVAKQVLRKFDHSVDGRRTLLMFIALSDEWGR